MNYPRMEKYEEAMQNHRTCLTDEVLKKGTIKTSGIGIPITISGGFALTYTIETPSKKYAVRCFHKQAPNIEERYSKISTALKSFPKDYFLDFEYQKNGIRIDNQLYPIVKMEWAKGTTLGEFFEDNYDNKQALKNLSASILKLSQFLEKAKIAHGDIQTGNMMVADNGNSIKLIDYDGFYLDSLKNLGSSEVGHINFQHPLRAKLNPFNERNDRFSLILIWLACIALIEDSKLWNKTKSDSDNFLFRVNDFISPKSSDVFGILFGYQNIKNLVQFFADICQLNDLNQIPSLSDFIQGIGKVSSTSLTTRHVSRAITVNNYISPYKVVAAADYQACFAEVGNKVEVVGKIIEVYEGIAKNKRPYIFINFGDWKGEMFKIAIWHETLAKLKDIPSKSWIGKWISIKGLMDQPFTQMYYGKPSYTHISITLTGSRDMTLLSEQDAQWRLNTYRSRPVTMQAQISQNVPITNADILSNLKSATTQSQQVKPAQSNQQSSSSNNSVLAQLQKIQADKAQEEIRLRQQYEAQQRAAEAKRQADLVAQQQQAKKREEDRLRREAELKEKQKRDAENLAKKQVQEQARLHRESQMQAKAWQRQQVQAQNTTQSNNQNNSRVGDVIVWVIIIAIILFILF